MGIKSKLAKATMLSLTAGSLMAGGLAGITPAFADGPTVQTPQSSMYYSGDVVDQDVERQNDPLLRNRNLAALGQFGLAQAPLSQAPFVDPAGAQTYVAPMPAYVLNFQPGQQVWPYFWQYQNYNLPYYLSTGAVSISTAESAAIIAASADVLGLPPQTVVAALAQGQSLTQIAAARGWARTDFVNALNSALQARIAAAINAGSIDSASGLSLLYALNARVNASVDQAGFPIAPAVASNVWYQIFS